MTFTTQAKFVPQKKPGSVSEQVCGLILAQVSQTEFVQPALGGTEPWSSELARLCQHFNTLETESKTKQRQLTTLAFARAGAEQALPLHLSKLDLAARSRQLESESAALLQWGGALAAIIAQQKWQRVALPPIPGLSAAQFRLVLEGLWFGSYRFEELKQKRQADQPAVTVELLAAEQTELLSDLEAQLAGVRQTLELVLSPANICTPEFFCAYATERAGALANVRVAVWDEERLAQEGMNLLLAVGRGSPQPSRLLILDYRGTDGACDHIALVGKGVCFDTGGTNLKSSSNIGGMQYDMMGAAIVYGAFFYLASTGFGGNLRAYLPLVENQIGGSAIKTGDIVRSALGPSIEINNTDAEGRLILADAIYQARRQQPSLLLDCATLTGAAGVALGEQCAAYYCNDEHTAQLFAQASQQTAEAVWRMPLFRPYASYLESKLADFSNIPSKSSLGGGSVTAALFLEKFALPANEGENAGTKQPWLHLDLAAWSGLDEHPALGVNSRALGLRLLAHFLRQYHAVVAQK